jgi:hypothetical protein
MLRHGFADHIEECRDLLATDGRKVREEVVYAIPYLQIVHQRLNRDTRSFEHRRAGQDFRVDADGRMDRTHDVNIDECPSTQSLLGPPACGGSLGPASMRAPPPPSLT